MLPALDSVSQPSIPMKNISGSPLFRLAFPPFFGEIRGDDSWPLMSPRPDLKEAGMGAAAFLPVRLPVCLGRPNGARDKFQGSLLTRSGILWGNMGESDPAANTISKVWEAVLSDFRAIRLNPAWLCQLAPLSLIIVLWFVNDLGRDETPGLE